MYLRIVSQHHDINSQRHCTAQSFSGARRKHQSCFSLRRRKFSLPVGSGHIAPSGHIAHKHTWFQTLIVKSVPAPRLANRPCAKDQVSDSACHEVSQTPWLVSAVVRQALRGCGSLVRPANCRCLTGAEYVLGDCGCL